MDQFDNNDFEQDFEITQDSEYVDDQSDEDKLPVPSSETSNELADSFIPAAKELPVETSPKPNSSTLPDSTSGPSVEEVPVTFSEPLFSSDILVKNLDPRVVDLIYWHDVKKTGIVFGSALILLLSLAIFSVLSVIAYLSLAALTVTLSFFLYKKVLQIVQKTGDGHPFKQYLEADLKLSEENVRDAADQITKRATESIIELRRLFLVGDLINTVKFALLLWVLTYIGSWFNGMTLLILGLIALFVVPKFYETNKTIIDEYVHQAKAHLKTVYEQVQQKIPMLAKKKNE